MTRRYVADGYSDYIYLGNTDWLSRETWHAVSGNSFDLVRYEYTNGRPNRLERANVTSDLQNLNTPNYYTYYLQYNWHGDTVLWVLPDGTGTNTDGTEQDAFGVVPNSNAVLDYYRWNGGWGYMYFSALKLYYVHGRWYNPETALWLSPDEKGEYLYGSGQDAVNLAQADACANRRPPTTPPVGGISVDWIKEDPNNDFPVTEIFIIQNVLKRDIMASATRHNTLKTNMDDNAFAALLAAILHWEGKLPGNGNSPEINQQNRDKDFWASLGANISTGLAKIKPSVGVQILRGDIPRMGGRYCYTIEGGSADVRKFAQIGDSPSEGLAWDPRFIPVAQELLDGKLNIEYLAANIERGADRINSLGFQASVFNLATWHNRGIQTPGELGRVSEEDRSYGNVILATMPSAMRILGVQGIYLPYSDQERDWVRAPGLRSR